MPPKVVCALEGCHGCGKTTVIETLRRRGVHCLDECFIDVQTFGLPQQGVTNELLWMSRWFERVLRCDGDGDVVVVDRSPYSAAIYMDATPEVRRTMTDIVRHQIEEMRRHLDVRIITVHLSTSMNTNWNRIQSRLQQHPQRVTFHEDNETHFKSVWETYDGAMWDVTVDAEGDVDKTADQIIKNVCQQ